MKKLIIFLSVAMLLSFEVNAQTLATDTFNSANGNMPAVGANFNVPINVTSIGEVLTLTVFLQYDTTVLNYIDSANAAYPTVVTNLSNGIIKVQVSNFPNPTTIADGKLIDIQFYFVGGTTDLTFGTVESPVSGNKSYILHTDYSTSYFHDADVTNGAVQGGYTDNSISGGAWNTAANWSAGVVPNSWHNVTVNAGTETTIGSAAYAHNLTIAVGGQLTLNSTLTLGGDMTLQSDASGDGSFIGEGTDVSVGGTVTVERYVTNGQWHGFSSPVSGATFVSTFHFNGTNVWVKEYDEATDAFTYLTDTNAVMGEMTGYYTWLQTSGSPQTFNYDGSLRSGTIGSSNNMSNSGTGFNFVGNPFTSALDWDAASGWTKTNLDDAIYVYNGTGYSSYIGGAGTNGGSQYIAMGQGFFVHVAAAGTGTLQVDQQAAVHNTVPFMKDGNADQIVRLQVADGNMKDETVIRFSEDATDDFDGSLDAYKFFSFDPEYPQIYSVNSDMLSINSLPFNANNSITLNVKGKDGNEMTISSIKDDGIAFLNLKDNKTGTVTDLKSTNYTFTYDGNVSNRFELFFGFTGIDEPAVNNQYAKIYSVNSDIQVILDSKVNKAYVFVYNLLGQTVAKTSTSNTLTSIHVEKTGYYLVKVDDGSHVTTQKVFIK